MLLLLAVFFTIVAAIAGALTYFANAMTDNTGTEPGMGFFYFFSLIAIVLWMFAVLAG